MSRQATKRPDNGKPFRQSTKRPDNGKPFRQSMGLLHTWVGLVPSWILYFMFITGTAGYFNTEITEWMQPELPFAGEPASQADMLAMAEQRLRTVAAEADEWEIYFPDDRSSFLEIHWEQHLSDARRAEMVAAGRSEEDIDAEEARLSGEELLLPNTGEPVTYARGMSEARDTEWGYRLYIMHYALYYLPRDIAEYVVILCTLFMLVALVTGIVIHKKIFKDFFTFRPGKKQRSWLDAHNVFSVLSLPFQFMITYSGLLFFMSTVMPLLVFAPVAFMGFDVPNMLAANDVEDMSPKNQALIKVVTEEVFNQPEELAPAGEAAPLAPLGPMLAHLEQTRPGQSVTSVTIDNAHDRHARVVMAMPSGVGVAADSNMVFDGVSGERIVKALSSHENTGVLAGAKSVDEVMTSLHEGRFAPPLLRWLYFASGLMGAGMIATGAILWANRRREKAEKQGVKPFGLALVERLNVATLVGLPIAVAVYFWANRLIPADMPGRSEWEAHAMFIAWGLMCLHAIVGVQRRVWQEQLWVAALVYALIPVLNVATSERHLGASLPQGDWIIAGFDLASLAIGLGFGAAARRAQNRQTPSRVWQPATAKRYSQHV